MSEVLKAIRVEEPPTEVCAIVEATATSSFTPEITSVSVRVYGPNRKAKSPATVRRVTARAMAECIRIDASAPEGQLVEVRISQRFPTKRAA